MPKKATASRAELAKTLGVASSTLRVYSTEDGFPEPVQGETTEEFEVLAVSIWWIVNKATKTFRRDLRAQLGVSLGEIDATALTAREEREQLDLQLKDAEVQQKLGELIRVSQIRSDLQRFAANLSDAFEAVERTSGQPLDRIIEPVFEEFFRALDKKADPR